MAETPRFTVRCEYSGSDSPPDEVSFGLSPSYGLLKARDVHDCRSDERGWGQPDYHAYKEGTPVRFPHPPRG